MGGDCTIPTLALELPAPDTDVPAGCVRLQLVLPFPDSRRQKAEVPAVCQGRTTSAADRSQSLDTDRASATLTLYREWSRLVFIRVYLVVAPPKSVEPSDVSLPSPAA